MSIIKQILEERKMKGKDPCWKGYEMIGTKDKDGKKVPNCVPKNEETELEEAFKPGDKVKYETSKYSKDNVGTVVSHKGDTVTVKHKDHLGAEKELEVHHSLVRKHDDAPAASRHKVLVTVSDPHHPAVTQRKEKAQRILSLSADSKESAVEKAKTFYKKKGLKVHDAEYHSAINEAKSTIQKQNDQDEKDGYAFHPTGKEGKNFKTGIHVYEYEKYDREGRRTGERHWRDAKGKHYAESVEQIDELSKDTLKSYVKKAATSATSLGVSAGGKMALGDYKKGAKSLDKGLKRSAGISKAVDRLTKEETEQLVELSKATLMSYAKKAEAEAGEHSKKAIAAWEKGDKETDEKHFKKMSSRSAGAGMAAYKASLKKEESETPVAPVPGMKWKKHAVMYHADSNQRVVIDRKNVGNYPEHEGWKEIAPGQKVRKEEAEQIDELSTATLASYKKKAGADASAADKVGNFKKADKRFSGIIKATNKQFANDLKKEGVDEERKSDPVPSVYSLAPESETRGTYHVDYHGTDKDGNKQTKTYKLKANTNHHAQSKAMKIARSEFPHHVKAGASTTKFFKEASGKEDENNIDVQDTDDYKLSKSGRKVRAHKIVFNKGQEETSPMKEEHIDEAPRGVKHKVQIQYKTKDGYAAKHVIVHAPDKAAAKRYAVADHQKKGYEEVKALRASAINPIKEEAKDILEALRGNQHKIDLNKNGKVDGEDLEMLRKGKKKVEERALSDEEMKERERIVKGMKKSYKDFSSKYGERAKDVMYATATKLAKEDVDTSEE